MDAFYRAFEERYRGSRDLIKSRLEVYLPFVEPLKTLYEAPEILDLGCGRGEWLELLQQNGFLVKGVDLDEAMLLACRELNLDVCQADALDYVRGLAAESLCVVSAFHVVEHISFETLRQLVDEAFRVLKPGGLLILETPNSENLVVGTSSFYLDPSHQRPLPALLLSFVVEYEGFMRVKTLYLQDPSGLATAEQTTLINVLHGVSPDYAVIAQKKATEDVLALFDEPFERSYGLRLSALAERYDQQTVNHAQWLQNEWDAAQQKIEELSKRNGQLEAVLAAEQQKAENLAVELSQINELSAQLQIIGERRKSNVQLLQNEWDAAQKKIEELSKRNGQLEAVLAAEQQKTINLAAEFNAVNELNTQLQAHTQWLQSELNAVSAKVQELNNSSHHWWSIADSLNQELKTLYASRSWSITKPLRLLSLAVNKIINCILAIPKGLWLAVKFPFKLMLAGLISFILKRPKLKARAIAKLRKHPGLEAHLCRFARLRGIALEEKDFKPSVDQNIYAAHVEIGTDLSQLTPRAHRIYQDLKAAIEQQKENS